MNPFHESDKPLFEPTFQKSSIRFSCNTSRSVWVDLVTYMYFSGIGNVSSSARGVELEVHCDDERWSHLGSTKNRHRLQRHLLVSVGWDSPDSPWSSLLRSSPLTGCSRLIRSLSLTNLLYLLQMGKRTHHLFVWSVLLSRWFFEDKFLMRPTFRNLPNPQPEYLLSKSLRDQFRPKKDTW